MVHAEDDGDAAASVASTDVRGSTTLDDENVYDGYSKNLDDEQAIDETIDELTEERYVREYTLDGRSWHTHAHHMCNGSCHVRTFMLRATTRVASLEKLMSHLLQYMAPEDVPERYARNTMTG